MRRRILVLFLLVPGIVSAQDYAIRAFSAGAWAQTGIDMSDYVAHYGFENSGALCADATGNFNLTVSGAIQSTTTVKQGTGSASFDGINDYCEAAATTVFDYIGSTTWTVILFARAANIGAIQVILGIGSNASSASFLQYMLIHDPSSTDFWRLRVSDGTTIGTAGSTTATTATWYCIAAGYDAPTDEIWLYNDVDATTGTATLNTTNDEALLFRLGTESDGALPLNGFLDHLTIFERRLSQAEINHFCAGNFNP